ncbi:hypothetical protein [Glycomyces sp. NPDC048151]|uniref:hypothetical protein n=1 Tax=Glycomyces sp. NPDC048151 TaxID=3364002 RepID=UPI00371E01E5
MTAIACALLLAVAGCSRLWRWWTARLEARERQRAEMDARLRDMFQARASEFRREVHGKTVAEILAEDPESAAQLARELDADTDAWTEARFRVIAYHLRRDFRFRLRLRAAARTTRSKT